MCSQPSTSSPTRLRRARNLLGTFVEISTVAEDNSQAHVAIDRAFESIERVEQLMSYHSGDSDLTLLNRTAFIAPVKVDPWTLEVLKCARDFFLATNGIFDCTVARELMEWQLLPVANQNYPTLTGTFEDVQVLPGGAVRFARPLALDFGGIAKGFAVDKAVETLEAHGISQGIVNAGGDMRVFGAEGERIALRDPEHPERLLGPIEIANQALATSSPHATMRDFTSHRVSALVNGRTKISCSELISLSIAAPSCVVADGMTKLISAIKEDWSPLLSRFGATAYYIRSGEILVLA